MLVINRAVGQSFLIGDDVEIKITGVSKRTGVVELTVHSPGDVNSAPRAALRFKEHVAESSSRPDDTALAEFFEKIRL